MVLLLTQGTWGHKKPNSLENWNHLLDIPNSGEYSTLKVQVLSFGVEASVTASVLHAIACSQGLSFPGKPVERHLLGGSRTWLTAHQVFNPEGKETHTARVSPVRNLQLLLTPQLFSQHSDSR